MSYEVEYNYDIRRRKEREHFELLRQTNAHLRVEKAAIQRALDVMVHSQFAPDRLLAMREMLLEVGVILEDRDGYRFEFS